MKLQVRSDGYRGVLDACDELERLLNVRLSRFQKLLLMERGTVEGLLTVLQGRPIRVKVERQYDVMDARARWMCRDTLLMDSQTSEVLIQASSLISEMISSEVYVDLEEGRLGIGEILGKHRVETRRRIREIGHDAGRFYRTYDIYARGGVWFTITESFSRLLYSEESR